MDINRVPMCGALGAIAQLGEQRVLEVVFLSPDHPSLIVVARTGRGR